MSLTIEQLDFWLCRVGSTSDRPDAFKLAVDTVCARCSSKDWFHRPQLKFLHDAYVLAHFARHLRANEVRAGEPTAQWPDGFVKLADKIHNMEITSTHGGRKLGEEYRQMAGANVKMDPVENWVVRAESIPRFLEVVQAKSRKRYSCPVGPSLLNGTKVTGSVSKRWNTHRSSPGTTAKDGRPALSN